MTGTATEHGPSPAALFALAGRWSGARAAERANAQSYLIELAAALGAERPRPAGSGYEFEYPVKIVNRDGSETTNFVDHYKAGCFALEAKDEGEGKGSDLLLRKAFGQVRSYVGHLPEERPPYLLVLDVGKTLMVWDRWAGDYGGFGAGRKIDLRRLHENAGEQALLRDIWENPAARDPRGRVLQVTREIAAKLARLATSLEARGFGQEPVARFLIRCVFTAFAEDVGLLPDQPFQRAIEDIGLADPTEFAVAMEELWRAMDKGQRFGLRKLLRFNGHFFHDATALPLTREDLLVLREAARADWSEVEPSIFGTLLTRALDPAERHRLGAEYTPREYVERVVRPAVEEPLRREWTAVEAEVIQLRDPAGKNERRQREDIPAALARLRGFLVRLRSLRFLDPACGSGNFLYVTMDAVKRIEMEVVRTIEAITGQPELAVEEVGPWQFHGIEVKAWAREIAELTLWIGYHQWWRRVHGHVQPPEPVLRDTGTLEQHDAVLAWDTIEEDAARARPDPAPRLAHPVTGERVPDPAARLRYMVHRGARPAEWPRADFIIGNPPYLGNKRMREAFGDGYVDALRAAYPEVPDSADYVMYWWHHAATEVAAGRTIRAGLITTNSITQPFNRIVIERAAERGARVAWAAPDHPWVDEAGSAAVRVAMTVLVQEPDNAVKITVNDAAEIVSEQRVARLNSDLSADADVAASASKPSRANAGLSSRGFTLVGRGFVLAGPEAEHLLAMDPAHASIVRRYLNGKDLAQRPREASVIDFGLMNEAEALAYPVVFNILRDRVKPDRDANNDRSTRTFWWRFGRNREDLRAALTGLPRYLATPYVAKHRFFTFLDAAVAPDEKIVAIATDDSFHLGVLSSSIHTTWALAAGTRLGIGNDPVYNNPLCFDPFPFPAATPEQHAAIAALAEHLDRHRAAAIARDVRITMTGMYNVVEKLRTSAALTPAERAVHELAACGILRELHEKLDAAVAAAYGWTWPLDRDDILARLVALHDERAAEEENGIVRWLRPAYQVPRFGAGGGTGPGLDLATPTATVSTPDLPEWPAGAAAQITALQALLATGPLGAEAAALRFRGARRELVERHLDTLAFMGELHADAEGRYHALRAAG